MKLSKVLLLFLVFTFSCMTLQSKNEKESEMISLLNKISPLAKQIYDMQKVSEQNMKFAHYNPQKPDDASKYDHTKNMGSVDNMMKVRSISAEMSPYLDAYNRHKFQYMQRYGQIEYNEFIKRQGLSWGLGLYW